MTTFCLLALSLSSPLVSPLQKAPDSLNAPKVTVVQKPYKGWKKAYWISNNYVELVVVPEIGRVMRYAEIGQPNILWENAAIDPNSPSTGDNWVNFGGDKLWVAPQTTSTWPPDTKIDPGPYTVEVLPNGVRLTNPPDCKFQVRLVREITLADLGSKVFFSNRLQNLGKPRYICPWQVTQLDDPTVVKMPYTMTESQPFGFYNYGKSRWLPGQERHNSELWLVRSPSESRKFGSTGMTGELKAEKRGTVFHMVQEMRTSAPYPDQDSAQQVYLSADPLAYVELEQVGILARLLTKEFVFLKVVWSLSKKP